MMMMRNKVTMMTSSSSRKSFRSENLGGRLLRTLFVCALFAVFLSSSGPQRRPSATTKENNFGSYEYTRLTDVINNFLIAYVGPGKLLPSVRRTDVIFHAKRGLQEFSYDTLKSIKSSE